MLRRFFCLLSVLLCSAASLLGATIYVPDFGNATVFVVDSTTHAVSATVLNPMMFMPPFMAPFGAAVNQAGTLAYITDRGSKAAYAVNTTSNTIIAVVPLGMATDPILPAFTPDGSKVVVTDLNGSVFVINTATHMVEATASGAVPPFDHPLGVAISNDGHLAYVADQGNPPGMPGRVYIIDISNSGMGMAPVAGLVSNTLMPAVPFYRPTSIRISSDGSYAYLTDYDGANVFKIDIGTNSVVGAITNTSMPPPPVPFNTTNDVAISPTQPLAYVTDFVSNNIYVINTTTNTVTGVVANCMACTAFGSLTGVGFIPDGTLAYVSGFNSKVYEIDTAAHSVNTEVTGAFSMPAAIATTPIVLPPTPGEVLPPSNFSGNQIKNDFGVIFYLTNFLSWGASASATVAGYNVYRDGVKIAVVGSGTLQYADNNVPRNTAIQYAVTAFDALGVESTPVAVQVK